jgi:lipopolysaccharide/colanic/teichoic acid biosynthesis glycosyltransferase
VALSPVFLALAAAIRLGSGSPVLYAQERVGRGGKPFLLYKFRSMREGADRAGALVTGAGDPRVTPLGRLLRRTKLDELPQLWNVLRGDMSLVGPRPEVARYVVHYAPEQRRVLAVRPGLTDPATLRYRDEEALLARIPAPEREAFYLREVMPRKLALNLEYLARSGFWSDLGVLLRTVRALGRRGGPAGDGTAGPAAPA